MLALLEAICECRVVLPIQHTFDSEPNGLSWPDKNGKLLRLG